MTRLIDTSAWIHFLRPSGDATFRTSVGSMLAKGEAAWCDMVRVELWVGARGEQERSRLNELEAGAYLLPTDRDVWDLACQIAKLARDRGLTVPASDLVIFACGRRHGYELLHDDKHLDRLAELVPL